MLAGTAITTVANNVVTGPTDPNQFTKMAASAIASTAAANLAMRTAWPASANAINIGSFIGLVLAFGSIASLSRSRAAAAAEAKAAATATATA